MTQLIDKNVRPIRILKGSRGQTLIEYSLLLILIAIVVIAAVSLVGQKTNNMFSTISTSMP